MTTKITATIGRKIANELNVMAVPVSAVDNTGFPTPAVLTVEAKRVVVVKLWVAKAVPPPAMIAKIVVIVGLISTKVEAMTTNPATVAKGMAIVSNKLSTNGM